MNYTYLLRCADGSLYCGWSNDLEGRIRAHNEGRGAKYTRSRRPAALAYCEMYATKEEALRREAAIKRMKKEEKADLIQEPSEICADVRNYGRNRGAQIRLQRGSALMQME